MKRIFVFFLIICAIYLCITRIQFRSWSFFGNQTAKAAVNGNIERIHLNVSGANAVIIPEKTDQLQAELKGKGQVIVKQSGDRISVIYKRGWLNGFSFFDNAKLTILLPENYSRDLSVDIGSGNVHFTGSPAKALKLNELIVEVRSGNLHLKNVRLNHFDQHVLSGNARIDSVMAKDGYFTVTSGNVTVNHYSGKIKAKVASGHMKAQLDQLIAPVDVRISSGYAQLDLPENADFRLDGTSSSGKIINKIPLANKQEDRHHLQGLSGSGKYGVSLNVSSGVIEVY